MRSTNREPKFKSKQLTRTFEMKISRNLHSFRKWANQVIQGIEKDKLLTVNPDRELVLDLACDGSFEVNSCYSTPINIKEWLPIACQSIRAQAGIGDDFERETYIACYKSNAAEVLFPIGAVSMPLGPVAFSGEIIFKSEYILATDIDKARSENAFKFILAHELVHVFNMLRLLVPAFKNWKKFWNVCLAEGIACDSINQLWNYQNVFVDTYGTEIEYLMIEEYWPQQAKKWFDAFRR
jgi:hypothetical protein